VLLTAPSPRSDTVALRAFDSPVEGAAGEGLLHGEKGIMEIHMNKMSSFRSEYVEDALLITAVIIIAFGLYLAAAYLLIVI
jgi:hypothetical protein